jgi:gluconolactonase
MGHLSRRGLLATSLAAAALPARATDPAPVFAKGLRFPEGPIALADGSVIVSEIAAGRIVRLRPDGTRTTIAAPGGGPNGNAIGPDGALYSCNNGGFTWSERDGLLLPGHRATDYAGGHVDRIDLATGKVTVLYRGVGSHTLSAPNDIVFDRTGGFWFTDHGAATERTRDNGGLYYATADGSLIKEVVYPLLGPNGVALSPDGRTVYVCLTYERLVLAFDIIGPGAVAPGPGLLPGRPVIALPANTLLDSMKVEADGTLCVTTLLTDAGVLRCTPEGRRLGLVSCPDLLTTNIAFGGPDRRTAFVTQSTTGQVLKMPWPGAGLAPAYPG